MLPVIFEKTIKFDGYEIADRLLEGVIFDVTIRIHANKKTSIGDATAKANNRDYLMHIGGEGAVTKWTNEVKDYFKNEDIRLEYLGEQMSNEEYAEWFNETTGELK